MTTLHIINSAKPARELQALLEYCAPQDAVLFIQDGCYCLLSLPDTHSVHLYALVEDIKARNIQSSQASAIDYPQFVELTLSCKKTISW